MLKIIFGEVENSVYHPPTYFDNQYEDEWITNPLTVTMIRDIDKSEVVGAHLIESPVLGPISVKEISGGVKTKMTIFEKTFDNAAIDYDHSRPTYVKEIYEDIFRYKPIGPDSHVLEIGLGTGKASQPILDTRCHFTGIEPGERLTDLARKRYRTYANFAVCNQTLQDFISSDESFDLIYAATAFHWIPEEYGYKRVHELLKPGGAFARFAYHAGTDKGREEMTEEIQEIYSKYMHQEEPPREYGMEDAKKLAETACRYGFCDAAYRLYSATKDFTADEYMTLLRTYPNHMQMEESNRKMLFEGIHSAIRNHGGIMTVYYTMDLELARKPV